MNQFYPLILKCVHRSLTDATKAYSDRHREMSDRRRNNLHNNTAQRISICLTGVSATKQKKELGVKTFRDALTVDQLRLLQQLERLTAILIDKQDMYPLDAVTEAASRLLLSVDL